MYEVHVLPDMEPLFRQMRSDLQMQLRLPKEYWTKEAAEEAAAKATKEATSRTLARDRILFDLLLTQERYEEAKRAAKDPDYQMKLLNEYGI